MIFLFVHQNFPGQYRNIIRHLANDPENQVYFVTQNNNNWMDGVAKIVYTVQMPKQSSYHQYTIDFDKAVRTGLAVAQVCRSLRDQGIIPDFIAGHSGWGETLYLKDVFPESPLLSYFEFYYHYSNVDMNFDPEFRQYLDDPLRLRTKNAVNLLSFDATDWGNAPTAWQRSLYPPEMRPRITTIHEGVNVEIAKPCATAWLQMARQGLILRPEDEVVTYVARNLEPYRGFHIFMRAAAEILRRRPKAHVVIVGGDSVSYGAPAPNGQNYRMMMLAELGDSLPLDRVHFLGKVPYEIYLNLLQVSSAHVYLTYPFVLSWSFIEAMACGCAMIGSATPPVQEVMKDGVNGLEVDFFDFLGIADRVDQILDDPTRMNHLRVAARETAVTKFDFMSHLMPKWMKLIDDMVEGRKPALN
jgi:glycosyltransferase involved in cell wall biosynthesis